MFLFTRNRSARLFAGLLWIASYYSFAQGPELGIRTTQQLPATSVKNQGVTGTCWCYSTTSMVESECLRKNLGEFDLSEMFTVRYIYLDKARNYVRRQGKAQFDEGGLGHDVLNTIAAYGAVPESVYSGMKPGEDHHDHSKLVKDMRTYLNEVLKKSPLPVDWEVGFNKILDEKFGTLLETFEYQGKTYTPRQFADQVLQFNPNDYIGLTSYTHHPYNQLFIVEIPDNWANGSYLNVPLADLFTVVNNSLAKGYTVMWDADISNAGFSQKKGYAVESVEKSDTFDAPEKTYDQRVRQQLFDTQITTDDHLMQITGMGTSPSGKKFYLVKNSWGDTAGPYKGYIYVSESYFALNTVTVIVPKAALN
ncbi:MAG: C1 family peptidase [Siphonobacter sp.]